MDKNIFSEIENHLVELGMSISSINSYTVQDPRLGSVTFYSMLVHSIEANAESGMIAKIINGEWKLYAEI